MQERLPDLQLAAQGIQRLCTALLDILAKAADALSPRMARIIETLAADWRRRDERVEEVSTEIEMLARKEAPCQRLMTVPGIGPLISSATVATIGAGDPSPRAAISARGSA